MKNYELWSIISIYIYLFVLLVSAIFFFLFCTGENRGCKCDLCRCKNSNISNFTLEINKEFYSYKYLCNKCLIKLYNKREKYLIN